MKQLPVKTEKTRKYQQRQKILLYELCEKLRIINQVHKQSIKEINRQIRKFKIDHVDWNVEAIAKLTIQEEAKSLDVERQNFKQFLNGICTKKVNFENMRQWKGDDKKCTPCFQKINNEHDITNINDFHHKRQYLTKKVTFSIKEERRKDSIDELKHWYALFYCI
ncbi:hypothetical protein A3Q56_02587 [Intoshia linei]|uniref:Uncharacterized protein n=1 Tax=Intoshia linei TaxID=1819745 RepID=A0A177B7M9_9BILA|nr:hypothetical protein A3Q56_02587 [Intoshia linei]